MPNDTGLLENYSDIGTEIKEGYSDIGIEILPTSKTESVWRKAPPKNFIDDLKTFFNNKDKQLAKAQNVYAISEVTGLSMKDVFDNYDLLRRSSKVTGITPDLERDEYNAIALTPFVIAGAISNPIGTVAGLLTFAALEKAIPTDEIIERIEAKADIELGDSTKTTIETIDLIAKGLIVRGVFKKAPKLAENFIKQKLIQYNMAKDIKLSTEQVRDIFQTGKLTTTEQQSLFGELNLTGPQLRTALEKGVKITIPAEKVVTMVDKPIWAKIKNIVGLKSKAEVTKFQVGKAKQAVFGLIEGAKPGELVPVGKVAEVVGKGEIKIRGLAKGVEIKAIESKLTQSFADLPEYQEVNMKEQASKAQELLNKDPEKAKRVAMGEELAPEGILPESVFVAVENQAIKEADVDTLRNLAVSSSLTAEATTMGQRIRTLAERNPESPVTAINEVVKAREAKAKKQIKGGVKKAQEAAVKEIKEYIKKVAPTKETWASFVKSIQC